MKTNNKSRGILEDVRINIKIKLSALWITVMILYIYNDIFALFDPGALEEMIAGKIGPFPVTQMSLFSATVLMIIPAVMIFLSLILKSKVSRWANIIVGILYTVVGVGNLIGETWAYYISSGILTTLLTMLVVFYAWKWPKQEV